MLLLFRFFIFLTLNSNMQVQSYSIYGMVVLFKLFIFLTFNSNREVKYISY